MFVAPSILAADFGNLEREVNLLNSSEADYLHIDVMDGVFVPNISFGFPVIKSIQKVAKKPLDFHLMIVNPDQYLQTCVDHGAKIITVHFEACIHLNRTVTHIRELGVKAGVAINPHTPISHLVSILPYVDLVLIMSVNPGFGGQKFIPETPQRVAELRKMAEKVNPHLLIEIDGGVNLTTGKELAKAGANVLVAGSFIFAAKNPSAVISDLKKL